MLIESGLVFFMAQLIWVECFSLESTAFNLVSGPITIIYVRAYLRLPRLLFNMFYRGLYQRLLWCVSQWQVPQIRHVTRVRMWKALWSLHLPMSTYLQNEFPVAQYKKNNSLVGKSQT